MSSGAHETPDVGDESQPANNFPQPSSYMRSRRPELFSDTVDVSVPLLERAQLEYCLETLTSRKQEIVFEDFCRRLAEVEICPNLKPQTGPVGGGDSKTDSSTYPVANLLIERCYWGSPQVPTTENWAFAFSCKKQWRQKARDDVAKIAALPKSFSVVYFITSQFAKDKSRSQLEDELTEKYGFDVHVLDRTWILNSIFEHKHESLAIESLAIGDARRQERRFGPRDTERQSELNELLLRLRNPLEYYGNDYSIAADFLKAATLARGLERPRHEVDGLFLQARRLSKSNGYPAQIVKCAYHHAWTANWWYDDISTVIEVCAEIEPLFDQVNDASDLEMFINLQNLLWHAVARAEISPNEYGLWEWDDRLRTKLKELSTDVIRPNNALHTATLLAFLDLHPRGKSPESGALSRLSDCFRRARGHATYPLRRFTDSLMDLSEFIESMEGFDELFETVRDVLSEREGEIAEAKLLLLRGEQHLKAERTEAALRLLGQARLKASKEEILEISVRAAILATNCYLQLGLVWAARMEALIAAQLSCKNVDGVLQSAFHGSQATRLLAWIDLTQGRLSPFLHWMEVANFCLHRLVEDGFDPEQIKGSQQTMEAALCDRLILLDEAEAVEVSPLSDYLRELGFPMARWFLLYAAGRGNEITEEFTHAFQENVDWMHDFLSKWKTTVNPRCSAYMFEITQSNLVTLSTQIMGVRVEVESCRDFGAISFSEDLLGVLEAMLALADWKRLAFITDLVKIRVVVSAEGSNQPDPVFETSSDEDTLVLNWQPNVADAIAFADSQEFCRYLLRVCMAVFLHATIDPVEDLKNEIQEWQKTGTWDRALSGSQTIHAVADLIGRDCHDLAECIRSASLET